MILKIERHLLLLVFFLAVVFAPLSVAAQSAQSRLSSSAVLKLAMIGLGPAPGAALAAATEPDWGEVSYQELIWPLPQAQPWPVDEEGRPRVETRRLDELWHEVQPGERAPRLRTMYRLTKKQLEELNPELDLSRLEVGQKVLVWRRDADGIGRSLGSPQKGRQIYSEPVPPSEHYVLLYPYRSFGTYYTVSEIVRSMDAYYETFPNAAPLIVGDISFRTGRHINPHKSHQAGRDVDITLPRQHEPDEYNRFHHVRRDNLDAERTLWLLTNFIDGGHVQYIFLDWYHQRTLWRLAKEQGAPAEWLEEVFQYPRRTRQGIIRHSPGHRGHFHVRFYCQDTDTRCY